MSLDALAATREYIDLATAAIVFESARLLAAKLKTLRGRCYCEWAEADEPAVGYRGQAPCWKEYTDDGPVESNREWCPTCCRRQRLHVAYRAAMKVRGARMRSFQRIALRGIDLQRIDKEVRAMADEPTEQEQPAAEQEAATDDAATAPAAGEGTTEPATATE